jgi:hypothetical protein
MIDDGKHIISPHAVNRFSLIITASSSISLVFLSVATFFLHITVFPRVQLMCV